VYLERKHKRKKKLKSKTKMQKYEKMKILNFSEVFLNYY